MASRHEHCNRKYASLTRPHSCPTSSQHDCHHATLSFPLEPRSWLTRQAQTTPSRTRIRPGLRCRLPGSPPIRAGDATRIFFRVLASIAALSNLNLRLFDVSAARLHVDIAGAASMESHSEYGDSGSVLEGDGTRPSAETHVYLINPNYIQIIRVYTSFRSCAWPAGCSSLRRGGGRRKTRREKGPTCISNLADESQSRQMEAPNFGLYPLSTLYSGCHANPLRKLFGILLRVENVGMGGKGQHISIYCRCLVPATRCRVRNGRLALR